MECQPIARQNCTHYGQLGNTNQSIIRVFGLGEETGVTGVRHRTIQTPCTQGRGGIWTPDPGSVQQSCKPLNHYVPQQIGFLRFQRFSLAWQHSSTLQDFCSSNKKNPLWKICCLRYTVYWTTYFMTELTNVWCCAMRLKNTYSICGETVSDGIFRTFFLLETIF